jgi:ribosomal protein S18 acetylase RimI-like enzyme
MRRRDTEGRAREELKTAARHGTKLMTPKITLTDKHDDATIKALGKKLMDFNEVGSGRALDYCPLIISVTHPNTNELLGGLWANTAYSYLHIELLYLPEELRGTGLGRQLMAQAEQEAFRRRCRGVWLDTFSFQARGFYERIGYTVFGIFEDYPPGHSRFFLRKDFKIEDSH